MATPSLLMIPSVFKSGALASVLPSDGTGDFTVSRPSVATRVNVDGIIETMAADVPRIDYSDGGCPVLLTEPQSTNLMLESEPIAKENSSNNVVFESFDWSGQPFTNCVKFDGTTSNHYGGNVLTSTEYTLSAFFKMDDGSEPMVATTGGDTTGDVLFVIGNAFASPTYAKKVSLGNNIWKVSVTGTSSEVNPNNNGFRILSNSGKGFRVVGIDLKIGNDLTSYIKTEGTTVTCLADVITVTPPAGVTEIIETIDGVEQTPITTIPATYTVPVGNINSIEMN